MTVRGRLIDESRVNLIDKDMTWPSTHGELADWVLSIPGIVIVEIDDEHREGLEAYLSLIRKEQDRRAGVQDLDAGAS
jgi:hydrogenase maturation factor